MQQIESYLFIEGMRELVLYGLLLSVRMLYSSFGDWSIGSGCLVPRRMNLIEYW